MFNKEILINKTKISLNDPVYFIADIAANHDGDINRALKLIELAKEAGANAVKFQHHNVAKYVSDFGFKSLNGKFSHQKGWEKSIFEVYQDAQVPTQWTIPLKQYSDAIAIDFFSTPYDLDMIDHLKPYVCAFKIGSGDINNDPMLIKAASTGLPLLIACGAAKMDEVIHAIEILNAKTDKIILMQCNTNYTASKENFKYINLNVINTFSQKFPGLVLGLSDHTNGHATVLGAVMLGARVIEKHFTDDTTRTGPDHKFSMDPVTWKDMVDRTRELELAIGDGIKKIEENEAETVILQRRAIRAVKEIKAGERILKDNIEFQRPAPQDAYFPNDFDRINGKIVTKNISNGDYIRREHFE